MFVNIETTERPSDDSAGFASSFADTSANFSGSARSIAKQTGQSSWYRGEMCFELKLLQENIALRPVQRKRWFSAAE
jgi:hypothetical protein